MDGGALEGGSTAIEDEHRLDAVPEKFAYSTEETDDVGVAKSVAFFVADGFEELVDPDGGVDGQALAVEGGQVGWAGARLEDGPEAVHTHGGCLLGGRDVVVVVCCCVDDDACSRQGAQSRALYVGLNALTGSDVRADNSKNDQRRCGFSLWSCEKTHGIETFKVHNHIQKSGNVKISNDGKLTSSRS